MLKYILKRLGASLITLWVVVTVTFILSHAIPGGPFDREKPLPPEVKKNIEERREFLGEKLVNRIDRNLQMQRWLCEEEWFSNENEWRENKQVHDAMMAKLKKGYSEIKRRQQ